MRPFRASSSPARAAAPSRRHARARLASPMTTRLRRSCLAVPDSSPKMLAKAAGLGADEVFIDLEDAVAPEAKNDDTRRLVAGALLGQGWTAPTRAVRINAVGTPWWRDDLRVVVAEAGHALHCVIVPKVETVQQ